MEDAEVGMVAWTSFVEVLRTRVAQTPDALALRFLEPGREPEEISYAHLDTAARKVAAALAAASPGGARGERAVLLFPPGSGYVAAFFGCLYAGAIAVPVYPPAGPRHLPRLLALLHDCDPRFLVTTAGFADAVRTIADGLPAGSCRPVVVDIDAPRDGAAAPDVMDAGRPTTAFLQYTSGTTGRPKGVMVSHGNLLANSELIRRRFGHTERSRGVIWLPPYHDMGLIGGILQPIYAGFEVTLMSPLDFLRAPASWLRAISDYRATTSGGPDFAYDLCVRKVPPQARAELDLSAWQVAFTGAEQVRPDTLDRFYDAFASCGFRRQAFYPCYGLAEATLMVTGGQAGAGPVVRHVDAGDLRAGRATPPHGGQTRWLAGCGRPGEDHVLRIVEPDERGDVPPGTVGEIWVRGPSVAAGYWGTRGPFGTPAGGRSRYLRTGDLGFVDDDGELFVTGRIKDMIVVRGRNYSPDDIERTALGSDARLRAGRCAAFSPSDGDGELAVVAEVRGGTSAEEARELAVRIRSAVTAEHGLAAGVVTLLPPGELPVTSSGKVRRRECRRSLEEGTLRTLLVSRLPDGRAPEPAPAASDPDTTSDPDTALTPEAEAIRAVAAVVLDATSVEVSRPLTDYGLDSVKAVELTALLRRDAALVVPLEAILRGADCRELAAEAVPARSGPAEPGGGQAAPAQDRLTEGEQAIWHLQRLDPAGRAYRLCHAVELSGPVTADAIAGAWAALVRRHPALRTTFRMADGQPRRAVAAPGGVSAAARLETADGADWPQEQVERDIQSLADRPIDLERGPIWTLRHLDLGAGRHVLALATHHITADLWSVVLLLRELVEQLTGGAVRPGAPSMGAVVAAERGYLGSPQATADLETWRERLRDAPAVSGIAADRPAAARPGQAARHRLALGPLVADDLRTLARREHLTPFQVLLAAVFWLVHRYSGAGDIVLGAPSPGRLDPAHHYVVGMMVNAVPVRGQVADGVAFRTFAGHVGAAVRDALSRMHLPFPCLVRAIAPPREAGRSPLFQLMVSLQQTPGDVALAGFAAGVGELRAGSLTVRSVPTRSGAAPFPLTIEAVGLQDDIVCDLVYDTAQWDGDTIAGVAEALRAMLAQVCADPDLVVSRVRLPAGQLPDEPDAAPDRPVPSVLTGLADDARDLDADAVESLVGGLAARLRRYGAGPDSTVVLLMRRSAALVAAALAAARTGAAYVPVNPAEPARQVAMRLAAARPRVICVDGRPPVLDALGWTGPVLDLANLPPAPPATAGPVAPDPDNAAYIIFTSGTTGVPKGVCVPVRALVNFVAELEACAPLPDGAVCAWWTEATFDVSVYEIFSAAAARGRLLVIPDAIRLEPAALAGWLQANEVQCTYVPPFAVGALADRAEAAQAAGRPLALRRLMVGVEPIANETIRRIAAAVPGLVVYNAYGPTEATIYCTRHVVGAADRRDGPAPIGREVHGARVYLLDRYLLPVPPGAAGEVYVSGECVSRGYLGQPAQTAAAYLPDPFRRGARMYRTGDLARRDRHGDLHFLARRDTQVKLNGVRLELGEVEVALGAQPGVTAAAAAVRRVDGRPVLVGYVTCGHDAARPPELIAALRGQLPPAAVPGVVMILDSLPLTRHGKLDRAALPDPSRSAGEPPRGHVEPVIAEIWAGLLQADAALTREDDFFAIGGNSLLAEQAVIELSRRLDREVPVAMLFANSTIALLADALARERPVTARIPVLPRAGQDADSLLERVRALPDDVIAQLLLDQEVL
jgi:amino acid adenylation domain-containing protein